MADSALCSLYFPDRVTKPDEELRRIHVQLRIVFPALDLYCLELTKLRSSHTIFDMRERWVKELRDKKKVTGVKVSPRGNTQGQNIVNVQISSHYKWNMQVRYRSFSSCRRTFRL